MSLSHSVKNNDDAHNEIKFPYFLPKANEVLSMKGQNNVVLLCYASNIGNVISRNNAENLSIKVQTEINSSLPLAACMPIVTYVLHDSMISFSFFKYTFEIRTFYSRAILILDKSNIRVDRA